MGNIDKLKYNGVEYDLGKEVDDTLTQEGAPADAEAVGDALDGKVDKVTGKELSTNDYTTAEKTKLAGIADEANKTLIDTTLSITGQAADAKATGDAIETKVNMTDGLFNLDTTQGSGTTDGDLYTAIDGLGWGAVISNQLMNLKKLLTRVLGNALMFKNSASATVASQYSNANIKNLTLSRYGKTVYATFALEYIDGTTITPDTTIWSIPEGYRPYTSITRLVIAYRGGASSISTAIKITSVSINANGNVSLATSNATSFYGTATWQTEQ